MTTITIKDAQKLSKTEFSDLEDLQQELILSQENFELSNEHKEILEQREKEADPNQGLSWEELETSIRRKDA